MAELPSKEEELGGWAVFGSLRVEKEEYWGVLGTSPRMKGHWVVIMEVEEVEKEKWTEEEEEGGAMHSGNEVSNEPEW